MWWHILYHIIIIPAAILSYYFLGQYMPADMVAAGTGGLMAAGIATMAMLSALILALKIKGKKIEPIYLIEWGLLVSFGMPALFMNKGILLQLQETISGLLMGTGFFAWSFMKEKSVVKSLIPSFVMDYFAKPHDKFKWLDKATQKINHYLVKTPESTWKKIDYLWATEMTLSAGISLAVALIFPPEVWFIAKYIIGPVLTGIAITTQGIMMHRAVNQLPLTISSVSTDRLIVHDSASDKSEPRIVKSSSPLVFNNYSGSGRQKDEIVVQSRSLENSPVI